MNKGRADPNETCICGHARSAHIYHEGACRPGFLCATGCEWFNGRLSDQENDEPKPCPFCGSVAELTAMRLWDSEDHPQRVQWHVVCSGCKAKTPVRAGISGKDRALELWNRRAEK